MIHNTTNLQKAVGLPPATGQRRIAGPSPHVLIEQGFSIIPLRPQDKRPALSSWVSYQALRATDVEIAHWRHEYPSCNWGVVTGAVSGIFVIDADTQDQVKHWRSRLPPTKEVSTGKGVHFYLKLSPGVEIRNSAHQDQGWDVRGAGGFVVGEGSIHPSGAVYRSNGLPIANAPAWLLNELKPPAPVKQPHRPVSTIVDNPTDEYARARAACEALSPARWDEYESWTFLGMALSELGNAGLQLWDRFSATSEKYRPGECAKKWATFKRGGRTLATLYGFADEDDPAWRKRYKESCVLADSPKDTKAAVSPTGETPATPATEPTISPADWPTELPYSVEHAILKWPTASILMRALFLAVATQAVNPARWTIAEVVEATGVPEATARNGLKHMVGVLIAKAPDQDEFLADSDMGIVPGGENHSALMPKNAKNSSPGRPLDYYSLLPRDQAIDNLLSRVIAPPLAEKYFKKQPEAAPTITALLRTLGCDDPTVAAEVWPIVRGNTAEARAARAFRAGVERWRSKLADLSGAGLAGEWRTPHDYKLAVANRDLMGKQVARRESVLVSGLTAEQVDALLPELGAVREKKVEPVDYVPGKPICKAIKRGRLDRVDAYWPGEGRLEQHCIQFEPNGAIQDGEVTKASQWAANKAQAGARVIVIYQVASLIKRGTPEELAKAEQVRVQRSQAAKERALKRKPNAAISAVEPTAPQPYRGLDHSPEFAQRWLAALETRHGFTIRDGRLVRLVDGPAQVPVIVQAALCESPGLIDQLSTQTEVCP